MKKLISNYLWLLCFIGAAFVITMSIFIKVLPETIYYIVGILTCLLGVFRVVPLIKTTFDKGIKWVFFGETIIDLVVGIIFIVLGTKKDADIKNIFGYLLGGVLYLRGFIHLLSCAVSKQKESIVLFLVHIIVLTIGAFIFANKGFSIDDLTWFLFALGIICALFFIYDGYKRYKNYRYSLLVKEETEGISINTEKPKEETDTIDIEPQDDDRPQLNA